MMPLGSPVSGSFSNTMVSDGGTVSRPMPAISSARLLAIESSGWTWRQ